MVDRVLKKRYALQQRLGKNAGRQTWLARDLQTQELVAIKILAFDPDFQWNDLKLFEREVETLKSLSHPAIPRYLDFFKFETPKIKGFALVQNYIEAKSLEEWVKLGYRANESDLQQLARSVLKVLMYLHKQNPPVIHRDIKPSNILLGERTGNSIGRVYLVDFGSVQTLAAREGRTITVVGTYGYMPPEQFGGRSVPASDIYSLGATLIYSVTGMHPADLPQKDLRIQFEPNIALSPDWIDWLNSAIEPDLNSRLASAEQALKTLKEFGQESNRYPSSRKPIRSKVQIKRHQNSLEVIVPSQFRTGNCLINLLRLLCRIYIIALLSAFFLVAIESIWEYQISQIEASTFSLYMGFIAALFSLQSTRLKIDRHKVSLTYEFLGIIRYRVQPFSSQQTICKLGVLQHQERGCIRRTLQIWVGTRTYNLPTKHLSDREIDWISSELSEWLNLPIT